MRVQPPPAIVLAAAMTVLGACGMTGPAHRAERGTAAAIVEMSMHSFQPDAVTIRSGETVEWRNTSFLRHTVTADPTRAKDPANVSLPEGATRFHSGDIPAGQIFRHTFTQPGTYRYICLPHEEDGMLGTVIVQQGD